MSDQRKGMPSASSFARLTLCPGSYQLTLKARELGQSAEHTSAAAERGTRIHKWLENQNEIILDADELDAAQTLKERADTQVEILFPSGKYTDLREERLWFAPRKAKLSLSAQFDRVVYDEHTALTQNYKSGYGDQEPPETNAQLKVEALLVAIHLPKTIKRYVAQIVTLPFGVLEAEFTVQDMRNLYEEIQTNLIALENPNAALNPSPAACKYCPAINICQAVKNTVQPVIQRYSALPDGGPDAARLLDECTVLERLIEEVRAKYEEKCLTEHNYIPGYGIVPGKEVREITDFKAAVIRLGGIVPEEKINETRRYTMGSLEKLYAQAYQLKPKDARESFNKLMAGIIEVKQNKGTLKRMRGEPSITEFERKQSILEPPLATFEDSLEERLARLEQSQKEST